MDDAAICCHLEAQVLETARQRLLEKQGNVISHFVKTGTERTSDDWVRNRGGEAIDSAVRYAMLSLGTDDEGIHRSVVAGLKHRVLARTVTLPVTVDEPESHHGVCANMEYDEKLGGWDCKVKGNQDKANKWHLAFGYGASCPFWKHPNPDAMRTTNEELDELYQGDKEERIL